MINLAKITNSLIGAVDHTLLAQRLKSDGWRTSDHSYYCPCQVSLKILCGRLKNCLRMRLKNRNVSGVIIKMYVTNVIVS